MKNFLNLRNHFLSFIRFKSKSSKDEKEIIKRLDYESTLLYGETLKTNCKKSRKNEELLSEEQDLEECIYYEISQNQETNPHKCDSATKTDKDVVTQSLTQNDLSATAATNVSITELTENNESVSPSVDGKR